jgi:periplasmic protein TonB
MAAQPPANQARFAAGMYRSNLNAGDRAGTMVLVALIHAALAYAFLNVSGTMRVIEEELIPQLIDLDVVEPPPPIVEVPLEKEKPKEKEGAASPENIKSTATPVVAPKPRIELPVPPPMPVTETPNIGADPTQGAAEQPGPGTGAGGTGTGTGSGGSGSGTGGGGTGAGTRPVLITPTLEGRRDYPREVLRRWPRNGRVFVRFQVDVAGRPFNCNIDRSSGDAGVDQWTCSLVLSKLRFRPATDDRGRPVISWYGYIQAPTNF